MFDQSMASVLDWKFIYLFIYLIYCYFTPYSRMLHLYVVASILVDKLGRALAREKAPAMRSCGSNMSINSHII